MLTVFRNINNKVKTFYAPSIVKELYASVYELCRPTCYQHVLRATAFMFTSRPNYNHIIVEYVYVLFISKRFLTMVLYYCDLLFGLHPSSICFATTDRG
jgi:hypothetical protein